MGAKSSKVHGVTSVVRVAAQVKAAARERERTGLSDEHADFLAINSAFTEPEIRRLFTVFHEVDLDGSGSVDYAEMLTMRHLAFNPMAERVVAAAFARSKRRIGQRNVQQQMLAGAPPAVQPYDLFSATALEAGGEPSSTGDALSFDDFVEVLSPFAPGASLEDKLSLAFAVYDFDGDSRIGLDDLEKTLASLLPESTADGDDDVIRQVAQLVLSEADRECVPTLETLKSATYHDPNAPALPFSYSHSPHHTCTAAMAS